MKLIKIAVDERVKQLTRQMNSQPNPLIKEILAKEIADLKLEEATLHAKK